MIYRFGTFEFDAAEGALRREGRVVPLEPKPARALRLLVERAGELVTRDEMRAHLWEPGVHVDFDRALAYCMSQVRQALGDSADNPRFVQTVPRRGFKFIPPVQHDGSSSQVSKGQDPASTGSSQLNAPQSAAIDSGTEGSVSGARRIHYALVATALIVVAVGVVRWAVVQGRSSPPIVAVALFDNETGEAAYDLALSRMTDAVVERLTALGPNRVGIVGNNAVLRQPRAARNLDAIARETAASHVVLVQLQKRAPDLSLLLQLIRMSDGVHVWVSRIPFGANELADEDEQAAARIETAVRRFVLAEDVEAP